VVITANFLALVLRKETRKIKEEKLEVKTLVDDMRTVQKNQQKLMHTLHELQKDLQQSLKNQRKRISDVKKL
jgi:uncharacterized protein YoxC